MHSMLCKTVWMNWSEMSSVTSSHLEGQLASHRRRAVDAALHLDTLALSEIFLEGAFP
jgi:hypothetical protein